MEVDVVAGSREDDGFEELLDDDNDVGLPEDAKDEDIETSRMLALLMLLCSLS